MFRYPITYNRASLAGENARDLGDEGGVDSSFGQRRFTQSDVKPASNSPLAYLGIVKVSPIITTAVLLDAERLLGNVANLEAGFAIEGEHIVLSMAYCEFGGYRALRGVSG